MSETLRELRRLGAEFHDHTEPWEKRRETLASLTAAIHHHLDALLDVCEAAQWVRDDACLWDGGGGDPEYAIQKLDDALARLDGTGER